MTERRRTIKVTGSTFKDCGGGVLAVGNVDVEADACVFDNTGVAIASLPKGGLPADLATAVLESLRQGTDVREVEKTFGMRLKPYGIDLDRWIGLGANAATLIAAFAKLLGMAA